MGGVIAFCPPDRPYYNPTIMSCTQCPPDKPYYNSTINQCTVQQIQPIPVQCPSGFRYDSATQTCVPIQNLSNGTIVSCPPTTPIWDETRRLCIGCHPGYQWDSNIRSCVICANPANCGGVVPQNTSCQWNYQWNSTLSTCIKC